MCGRYVLDPATGKFVAQFPAESLRRIGYANIPPNIQRPPLRLNLGDRSCLAQSRHIAVHEVASWERLRPVGCLFEPAERRRAQEDLAQLGLGLVTAQDISHRLAAEQSHNSGGRR